MEPMALRATAHPQPRYAYTPKMTASNHSLYSRYREMLIEHLFAGEVMRHLWLSGVVRIEVLKPQVDDGGYDLVLEAGGVVRHVQLKATHIGSTTQSVKVHLGLEKKPSGCVVWVQFDENTMKLGPFLYFGNEPGSAIPSLTAFKTAKHTKGNAQGVKAERPNLKVIPKSRFQKLDSVEELVKHLFGNGDA
jgi:hypothetical protein